MNLKKKILSVIILICVFFPCLAFISACNNDDKTPSGGSGTGTKENPHTINDIYDWYNFMNDLAEGKTYAGEHVVLTDNIDFTDDVVSPKVTDANAFYSYNNDSFAGTFNGNGYTLSNITSVVGTNDTEMDKLHARGGWVAGVSVIFGSLEDGASVTNLKISGVKLCFNLQDYSGDSYSFKQQKQEYYLLPNIYASILAGYINDVTVSNVHIDGVEMLGGMNGTFDRPVITSNYATISCCVNSYKANNNITNCYVDISNLATFPEGNGTYSNGSVKQEDYGKDDYNIYGLKGLLFSGEHFYINYHTLVSCPNSIEKEHRKGCGVDDSTVKNCVVVDTAIRSVALDPWCVDEGSSVTSLASSVSSARGGVNINTYSGRGEHNARAKNVAGNFPDNDYDDVWFDSSEFSSVPLLRNFIDWEELKFDFVQNNPTDTGVRDVFKIDPCAGHSPCSASGHKVFIPLKDRKNLEGALKTITLNVTPDTGMIDNLYFYNYPYLVDFTNSSTRDYYQIKGNDSKKTIAYALNTITFVKSNTYYTYDVTLKSQKYKFEFESQVYDNNKTTSYNVHYAVGEFLYNTKDDAAKNDKCQIAVKDIIYHTSHDECNCAISDKVDTNGDYTKTVKLVGNFDGDVKTFEHINVVIVTKNNAGGNGGDQWVNGSFIKFENPENLDVSYTSERIIKSREFLDLETTTVSIDDNDELLTYTHNGETVTYRYDPDVYEYAYTDVRYVDKNGYYLIDETGEKYVVGTDSIDNISACIGIFPVFKRKMVTVSVRIDDPSCASYANNSKTSFAIPSGASISDFALGTIRGDSTIYSGMKFNNGEVQVSGNAGYVLMYTINQYGHISLYGNSDALNISVYDDKTITLYFEVVKFNVQFVAVNGTVSGDGTSSKVVKLEYGSQITYANSSQSSVDFTCSENNKNTSVTFNADSGYLFYYCAANVRTSVSSDYFISSVEKDTVIFVMFVEQDNIANVVFSISGPDGTTVNVWNIAGNTDHALNMTNSTTDGSITFNINDGGKEESKTITPANNENAGKWLFKSVIIESYTPDGEKTADTYEKIFDDIDLAGSDVGSYENDYNAELSGVTATKVVGKSIKTIMVKIQLTRLYTITFYAPEHTTLSGDNKIQFTTDKEVGISYIYSYEQGQSNGLTISLSGIDKEFTDLYTVDRYHTVGSMWINENDFTINAHTISKGLTFTVYPTVKLNGAILNLDCVFDSAINLDWSYCELYGTIRYGGDTFNGSNKSGVIYLELGSSCIIEVGEYDEDGDGYVDGNYILMYIQENGTDKGLTVEMYSTSIDYCSDLSTQTIVYNTAGNYSINVEFSGA